jgi:hypothetical protein
MVTGSVDLAGEGGQTHLVAETAEGMKEPLDYPIQDFRVRNDSVSLSFAPIGFSLHGRCVAADSMGGRFSVPNPPFDSIIGDWVARRVRGDR